MNRLFIVLFGSAVDATPLINRLRNLGQYYALDNHQFLLLANFQSAQELHQAIVGNNPILATVPVVVFSVNYSDLSYWGYSDNSLWNWLSMYGIVNH